MKFILRIRTFKREASVICKPDTPRGEGARTLHFLNAGFNMITKDVPPTKVRILRINSTRAYFMFIKRIVFLASTKLRCEVAHNPNKIQFSD